MADVRVSGLLEFAATEVTFEAVTEKAREQFAHALGAGARSFVVRKTLASAVLGHLEAAGLTVQS